MNRPNLFTSMVFLLGMIGVLFVSLVPPMRIPEHEMNCRFHFMAERSMPFSQTYAVKYPDVAAQISEYGLIVAICGILLAGAAVVRAVRSR